MQRGKERRLTEIATTTHRPERTFAVIVNASAGALIGASGPEDAIRVAFADQGLTPLFIGKEVGDLPARVACARDSGAAAIVVAGGDGTVACAARVLAGGVMPLGILPSGTMNLLARDLAIPVGDLAAAVGCLAEGMPRAIDVGEVNGHVFLCGSMIGLPTRLARYREAGRHGGWMPRLLARFMRAIVRTISASRPMRLDLCLDGVDRLVRTTSLNVTVNPLSVGIGRLFGRACLDGGRLGVYVVNSLRLADALRLGIAALMGRWKHDAVVEEYLGIELRIMAGRPALWVLNDGEEALLETPLVCANRRRALWVIAPPVATPHAP